MECETQWGDIQQWGEVADLYLCVLSQIQERNIFVVPHAISPGWATDPGSVSRLK